jgi:hypothetical protein
MIRIRSLTRTTAAFPSQWEGQTDDGQAVLIHYKRSVLSVSYFRYDGVPENHRFRLEEVFSIVLTADDFVDDELYDDGFAEFPTIAAVLKKAGIVDIPEGLEIPDGF